VLVTTVGHGTRPLEELVETLRGAGVTTLVDVRRFPGSRRNPQFNRSAVEAALEAAGIEYRHEEELGGRRSGEPGEERFACLRVAGFRSYAARMAAPEYAAALARSLLVERPCFMCAETLWWRCHRRLIAELLAARGHEVVHLLAPGKREPHRFYDESDVRGGRLYLCGSLVGERPSEADRLIQQNLFTEGTEGTETE
jgi:uncharacterized protein (DUF488 family)